MDLDDNLKKMSNKPCKQKNYKQYLNKHFKPLNNSSQLVFTKRLLSGYTIVLDCAVCSTFVPQFSDIGQHCEGHKHESKLSKLESSIIWGEIQKMGKDSMVGTEYLVELVVRLADVPLYYVCMLCDAHGDASFALEHFKSVEHRKTFLKTHFPSILRKMQDDCFVSVVCDVIEEKCGRLKPMVCLYEKFKEELLAVGKIIEDGKHFNEVSCPAAVETLNLLLRLQQTKEPNGSSPAKRMKLDPVKTKIKKEIPVKTQTEMKSLLEAPQKSSVDITMEKLRKPIMPILIPKLPSMDGIETPRLLTSLIKIFNESKSEEIPALTAEQTSTDQDRKFLRLRNLDKTEFDTLVVNFGYLASAEQKYLISYLQSLQQKDPNKFKDLIEC